jgi:hypothetical protein
VGHDRLGGIGRWSPRRRDVQLDDASKRDDILIRAAISTEKMFEVRRDADKFSLETLSKVVGGPSQSVGKLPELGIGDALDELADHRCRARSASS